MQGPQRWVTGGAGLALLLTVVGVTLLAGQPDAPLPLPLDTPGCPSAPAFRAFQTQRGAVTPTGEGWRLVNVGILQTQVCESGVLEITADGEPGGGAAPAVEIASGHRLLALEKFTERRTVRVPVPSLGPLTVTYREPYNLTEARSVILRNFRMPGCQTTTMKVSPEDTGAWYPGNGSAVLYSRTPATLLPCASGTLTLTVEGASGAGAYPILHIEQGGKRLLRHTTDGTLQRVSVKLTGAPATVYVANPYARLREQRVLNIRSLRFSTAD